MKTRTKLILWIGLTLLIQGVFVVVIVGLPWRGAYHQTIADIAARGEPVFASQLRPSDVPVEDNGGPLLESLWRDLSHSNNFRNAGKLSPSPDLTLVESQEEIVLAFAEQKQRALRATEWAALSPEERSARKLKKIKPPASVPAVKLSATAEAKLKCATELRQHVDSLSQVLADHPDLLERWESALSKPVFRFQWEAGVPLYARLVPQFGACRQSLLFLSDLSLYYQASGEVAKAQRCRLLMLRCPSVLDAEFSSYASTTRSNITGSCCAKINASLPLLSDAEIVALQAAAVNLKPWPQSRKQLLLTLRVDLLESLQASEQGLADEYGGRNVLFNTGLRYQQGLLCLQEFQSAINGEPIPDSSQLCFLGRNYLSYTDSITAKWKVEAARIRQLHLGLEVELIKRRTGRYPSDLSSIDLPKEDSEGHPMHYQVFPDGLGACLDFTDKKAGQSPHFPLGQVPKEHQK